jgi:hypothetical protein
VRKLSEEQVGLWRKIRLRIITPLNERETVFTAPVMSGGYTERDCEDQANFTLAEATKKFPRYAWRMVKLQPNIFNIIAEKKNR